MTLFIIFSSIGTDAGPFNLYSDVDSYISPFAVGVTKEQLLAGYPSNVVPNGTIIVRAKSSGVCTNYVDMYTSTVSCYNFIPQDSYYFTDHISRSTFSYFYGSFTGYMQNDVPTSYKHLIKLNSDLTIDNTFNVGTGFNEILYLGSSIEEQPDGKLIVTGTFTSYQGIARNRIIRLNTDATIDSSFVIGTGFNNFTQHAVIDSLGRIIVVGRFGSYNGASSPSLVRLLPDGTRDTTLVVGTGFNNTTVDVLVNADDTIIVSGYFNSYNGVAVAPGLIKLLANGTIDTSFVVGAGVLPSGSLQYNWLARLSGETSFYIAGTITSYKGTPVPKITKIKLDGDIDPSFNPGTGFNGTNIYVLTVKWENKLLVEGNFTMYNGVTSYSSIILNPDGSVYFAFTQQYLAPVIIGNDLFASTETGCLVLLHRFTPTITTTSSTTLTTTTTSTTAAPTTTTTTIAPSTTTTTSTVGPFNANLTFTTSVAACANSLNAYAYTSIDVDGTHYWYDAALTNPINSSPNYFKVDNKAIRTTGPNGIVTGIINC